MSAKSGRLGSFSGAQSFALTRDCLVRLKQKAVRNGCWFKDLKHEERKLLDLTIRLVQRVRSFILAKVVSQIVAKLCAGMESKLVRLIRTEGRVMAKKLSEIGECLGCKSAKEWAVDHQFMQFLVINNLHFVGSCYC